MWRVPDCGVLVDLEADFCRINDTVGERPDDELQNIRLPYGLPGQIY